MRRRSYMRTSKKPLKRVGFAKTASKKSGKKKKTSIWEQYGLKRPRYIRYSGRKGVYWWLFSQKIRQRDFEKYNGECIDCGDKADTWQELQAGHFVPASKGGFGLLFDEQNVNGQLPKCNNPTFSPMSLIGYAKGLDKRYGPGTADTLIQRKQTTTKEWSQIEYDTKIRDLMISLHY